MAKFLTNLDDLAAVNDVKFAEVEVPEWGMSVRFGSVTAGDMMEWADANEGPAKKTAGFRLIIRSLVDENGNRVGNDKWIEVLKKRDASIVRRLIDEISKLNGFNTKQETVKNDSGEASAAASHTDSPSV